MGESYIGSWMSLVTSMNVRYEGRLAEVNMENSSLRLADGT